MAEQDDGPIVLPAWETAFCRRHSEPFGAEWPKGAVIVQVFVLQHVMSDDRFTARFAMNAEGTIDVPNRGISEELVRVSPLCCFLGDELMTFITSESLAGKARKAQGS